MSRFGQGFEDHDGGEPIKARLKWFNATKGFGFLSPVDGSPDAFLHVSILQRAGLQTLGDNAEVLCEVDSGPKGPQVSRIIEILDPGQAASPRLADGHGARGMVDGHGDSRHGWADGGRGQDGFAHGAGGFDGTRFDGAGLDGAGEAVNGTVKWFKADKGFGFITVDGSGQDVFVHKSVLQRSGLPMLDAGQKVELRTQQAAKGQEATWVALI